MTRVVKRAALAFVLFVCTSVLGAERAASQDESTAFAEANARYESGEYDLAIEGYTTLVERGITHPALYYNLGNAHYKIGELGQAVLFYERALRLTPRDADVKGNLELVRSQLKDKQFVKSHGRVVGAIIVLHDNLSTDEMTTLTSVSYAMLSLLLVVFIFRETRIVSAMYAKLSLASPGRLLGLRPTQDMIAGIVLVAVLFGSFATSTYSKIERERSRRDAVVMARETSVLSSPTEDATLQFRIHEGTMVRTNEQRRGWVRIELPGGLSGWVEATSLERV